MKCRQDSSFSTSQQVSAIRASRRSHSMGHSACKTKLVTKDLLVKERAKGTKTVYFGDRTLVGKKEYFLIFRAQDALTERQLPQSWQYFGLQREITKETQTT